jgi:hypothetical protein
MYSWLSYPNNAENYAKPADDKILRKILRIYSKNARDGILAPLFLNL